MKMIPDAGRDRIPASLPAELREELEKAYRELQGDLAALGVTCWMRGHCCDFERSDHRLYASSVELAYVLEAHTRPLPFSGRLCPFWKEGRCTERERRPLGCRTYFCDERYRDRLEDLYETYYARLKAAAVRAGFGWSYEPFVDSLKRAAAQPCAGRDQP